jgi:hypothetical protein
LWRRRRRIALELSASSPEKVSLKKNERSFFETIKGLSLMKDNAVITSGPLEN